MCTQPSVCVCVWCISPGSHLVLSRWIWHIGVVTLGEFYTHVFFIFGNWYISFRHIIVLHMRFYYSYVVFYYVDYRIYDLVFVLFQWPVVRQVFAGFDYWRGWRVCVPVVWRKTAELSRSVSRFVVFWRAFCYTAQGLSLLKIWDNFSHPFLRSFCLFSFSA